MIKRLHITAILLLTLLGTLWSSAALVSQSYAQATLSAAIAGMTLGSDGRLWAWNPEHVWARMPGTDRMVEVKTPNGTALTNVRAVVEAGGVTWIMQADHVYQHVRGTTTTREVVTVNGSSIASARGVMGAAQCSSSDEPAEFALIWTDSQVFFWQKSAPTVEDLRSGAASVAGVIGVMPTCLESAWAWTPTNLYRWERTSRQLVAVRETNGAAVAGVQNVIVDPKRDIWIVTTTGVLRYIADTASAVRLVDANSLDLPTATVLAGHLAQYVQVYHDIQTDVDAWMATNAHLYRASSSTRAVAEILSPGGTPLAGVRGIVAAGPPSSGPQAGKVLIWNGAGLVAHLPGTNRTRPITDLSGASISNTRGVVALPGNVSTQVFFWNATGLYQHVVGTGVAREVQLATGAALPNLRGVTPILDTDGNFDVWAWSEANVYRLRAGMPQAAEMRDPDGMSISETWAILALGSVTWLRTEDHLYEVDRDLQVAHELRTTEGASLTSPSGGILALVAHAQRSRHTQEAGAALESGPWGASLVSPSVPKPLTLSGMLRGGVNLAMPGTGADLTTLTAFTNATAYVGDVGPASMLTAPGALLISDAASPLYLLYLPNIQNNP